MRLDPVRTSPVCSPARSRAGQYGFMRKLTLFPQGSFCRIAGVRSRACFLNSGLYRLYCFFLIIRHLPDPLWAFLQVSTKTEPDQKADIFAIWGVPLELRRSLPKRRNKYPAQRETLESVMEFNRQKVPALSIPRSARLVVNRCVRPYQAQITLRAAEFHDQVVRALLKKRQEILGAGIARRHVLAPHIAAGLVLSRHAVRTTGDQAGRVG